MKFEIIRAKNGWILKCEDSETETMVVGAETEDALISHDPSSVIQFHPVLD